MTARTTPVRFSVQRVNCRHCGEEIPIRLKDGLTPDEMLAECERQAEKEHDCPKQPKGAA